MPKNRHAWAMRAIAVATTSLVAASVSLFGIASADPASETVATEPAVSEVAEDSRLAETEEADNLEPRGLNYSADPSWFSPRSVAGITRSTAGGGAPAGGGLVWSEEVPLTIPAINRGQIGSRFYIGAAKPTGSWADQVGKDIQITRIVVKNTNQSNRYLYNLPIEVYKETRLESTLNSSRNLGWHEQLTDAQGRNKGVDAQIFDPATGEGDRLLIWSGSDNINVVFDSGSNPKGQNLKDLTVELWGSYKRQPLEPPKPPVKDQTWNAETQWGRQSTAVTPGEPGKVNSRIVMERSVDRDTIIRGTIDARLQHQNGWDLDGAQQARLTVFGPGNAVLHTQTLSANASNKVAALEAGNGWGGVRFVLPNDVSVPAGSRVAVEMSFHGRGKNADAVRDPSFEGPLGPGDLKLIMYPTDTSWLHEPTPNPPLPKRCGLRIAIVGDQSESLSYGDQNGWDASRKAAKELIDALQGTPSKVGIYSFASYAPASGRPGVGETAGTSGEEALNVNDPEGRRRLNKAIDEWAQNQLPGLGGSTNWEAGLSQLKGKGYDVVYFITDGIPTLNNDAASKYRLNALGTFPDAYALNSAIDAANELKREGTRIVPLMVKQKAKAGNTIAGDVLLKNIRRQSVMDSAGISPRVGDLRYRDSSQPAKDEFVNRAFYPGTSRFFVFQPVIEGGDYVVEQYDGQKWVDVTSQSEKWTTGLRGVTEMTDDISGHGDTVSISAYSQLANQLGAIARQLADFCKLTKTVNGDVEKLGVQQLGQLGLAGQVQPNEDVYKARYTVTYQGVGPYDSIIDRPQLPHGTRLLGARVSQWSDEFGSQIGHGCVPHTPQAFRLDNCASDTGPDTMATLRVISERPSRNGVQNRQKHDYTVEVYFARDTRTYEAAYPVRNPEVCEAANGDIVNVATMGENEAIACSGIPAPDPREFGFVVRKADYDYQTVLNDAEFQVRWVDEAGMEQKSDLHYVDGAYRSVNKLMAGIRYSLVETKAPTWQRQDGTRGTYSLLTKPVDFVLQWNEISGNAEIVFYDGDTPTRDLDLAGVWEQRPVDAPATDVYIQVANIRQGDLPKTGGIGVWVQAALSLLVIGGGIVLARKRA